MKDLFRSTGNVIRADVATTPTGRSRGFGTVLFSTSEEAAAAIVSFHGYDWHGRKMEVREDRAVSAQSTEDIIEGGEKILFPLEVYLYFSFLDLISS